MMKWKIRKAWIASVASLALIGLTNSSAFAAPAAGDFNGDGLSDLSVALASKQTGQTAWLTRVSAQSSLFWTFNIPGDALVTGKWYRDNKTYPGIVHVADARRPLNWYLKNPAGAEVFLQYGLPGDTVPNQGDVDCDGVTDFLVARNGGNGYKYWYASLSGSGGAIAEVLFGLNSDRIGLADMDGDSCAELVALRDGYLWFAKKLFRPEISQVQWGLPGDIPLLPLDINVDGQADYIVARPDANGQRIYVRYSSSRSEIFNAGQPTSVPMAGNFIGAPSFAWAQRDTGFTAILKFNRTLDLFPFGIAANAIIRPDGTVVQSSETGRFGSSGSSTPTPTPPSGGGGGGGGSVGNLRCDAVLDMTDGYGNNKYRPSSSKGRKMLWQRSLFGSIVAASSFDQAGNKYDDWEVYASPEYTAGPRTRAYSTKSAGSAPRPEIIVARLSNGQQVCASIPNPSSTID